MKRKIAFVCLVALLIVSLFALVACNKKVPVEVESNVSRRTDSFYVGEDKNFAASIEFGVGEKLFIADGKVTDVQNFVRLSVTPLTKNDFEKISYTISAGENSLSGELQAGNYGEFCDDISLSFAPEKIVLTAGETSSELELKNVLDGALSSTDAINIAQNEFADKLAKEKDEGKDREIYMKLISGDRKNYYYYVSFIGSGVDYWAILIDPDSGEIISKK